LEPISKRTQRRRPTVWLLLRIGWLPYVIYDIADGDMGTGASILYSMLLSVDTVLLFGSGIASYWAWSSGYASASVFLLPILAYTLLGLLTSIALRKSDYAIRMLPSV